MMVIVTTRRDIDDVIMAGCAASCFCNDNFTVHLNGAARQGEDEDDALKQMHWFGIWIFGRSKRSLKMDVIDNALVKDGNWMKFHHSEDKEGGWVRVGPKRS